MAQPLLHDPFSPRPRVVSSVGVLVAMAALFCGGGCLYIDPVNRPPVVQINPPSQIWRRQIFNFTASVSDPNGDIPNLYWTHTTCPNGSGVGGANCDPCQLLGKDYRDRSSWPSTPRDPHPSYDVGPPDSDGPFCVWAFATDQQGATTPASPLRVTPQNHPPVAAITMLEPILAPGATEVPMYSEIEFTAADSVDAENDDLTFVWELLHTPPGSSLPEKTYPGTCSQPQTASSWCLVPDVEGQTYTVQLTAKDPYAAADDPPVPPSTLTRQIRVAADQLPCLVPTNLDPQVASIAGVDPSVPKALSVIRVDDDGDPSPPRGMSSGRLHFNWFKGLAPGPLEFIGNDVPTYTVNPEYSLGDEVVVRVEIFDRKPDRIKAILQQCGDDKDTCGELNGQSVCNQRMTWHLHY